MSRCNDWHNAFDGVMNYLLKNDLANDKNIINISKKYIYDYIKEGSFSTRCLEVGKDFNKFKKYVQLKHKD